MAEGGLPLGRSTLLVGTAGAGKTVLASQLLAAGIATQSLAALWPAMTSATTSPSLLALCANIGTDEQSPMA